MTFSKNQLSLAVSCALALGVVSGAAWAQQTNPSDKAHLTDNRGAVATSGFGLCWHTAFGPAPPSTIECDPNFVPAPIAKAVEPAPQPVAQAAEAPKTAPTPAPKPPVIERVTLDADTLFDFDKAVLRPAGQVALDDFVGKIEGLDAEMIMAVGHADRIGSDAYNQLLSEQRVEAVKSYLVAKGIEAKRIQTEGKGETQPVTKTGDCDGAGSAKVIACLQPDRRVVVEVLVTRIAK